MTTMQVDIVTPERKVYSEQAEMVMARTVEGEIGILPGHSPLVGTLQIGVVRVQKDGQETAIAVSGGFMEVNPQHTTILAETAELPTDIDVERAEAAKKRAEERLNRSREEEINFRRAQLALNRAMTRLGVAKRK